MTYNKKTEGKPNLNKVYPKFIEEVAKVLDFGDKKYELMNWKDYKDINQLASAILRHINEFNRGNLIDNQSNLSHLSHIATNCMILQWLIDNKVVSLEDLYYKER